MSDFALRIAVTAIDLAIIIIMLLGIAFTGKNVNRAVLSAVIAIMACNVAMIWRM